MKPKTTQVDVLILGAGAAGLMAAIESGRRGRRTLVLDHADRTGKKILISGGGRSNFTNLGCRAENFLSENPHFARSALAAFTPADMVALVERHGVPYHEKTLGQLFCDRTARDLVTLLERECAEVHARIQLETRILSVRSGRTREGAGYTVETSAGTVETASVIVATGGLSIPKMGATGLGYDLARQFGLRIVTPRPALVPFTFSPVDRDAWCDLSGVSAETVASAASEGKKRTPAFREKVLLTHRGLSGPAALQISSYWQDGAAVALDLAPEREIFTPLTARNARRDANAALEALRTVLPARWAERWLARALPPTSPRELPNSTLHALERSLHAWTVTPAGTEGYSKAEVTAGGVDTAALDARTLEVKRAPGLYFIGEVTDVTGWLGGYNFQWAWASGYAAGQSA